LQAGCRGFESLQLHQEVPSSGSETPFPGRFAFGSASKRYRGSPRDWELSGVARRKRLRVSLHQQALFTRQFLTMFDAGVTIPDALEFYSQGDDDDMGYIANDCAQKIRTGMYFSKALSHYPQVFSKVFLGLVQAGENTGELSPMLERISALLERENRLQHKIKSSLSYPFFLLLMCLTVACIFIFFIMPSMEPMLKGLGVAPPWPTRVLMSFGALLRSPYFLIGTPLALLCCYFLLPKVLEKAREHPKLGPLLDALPLVIPVFGEVYVKVSLARVLFTIATTVDCGLTLTSSIDLARQVTGNRRLEQALLDARKHIVDGHTLAESLDMTGVFPDGLIQMVAIGEETASLSAVIRNAAGIYEENATNSLETAVALLEPFMLFGMGLVSGFLVLASILPLVKMLDSL
jgi:type II secretory pathway component PulF